MKNNDSDTFYLHITFILIKIVRILTKKPSEKPNNDRTRTLGKINKSCNGSRVRREDTFEVFVEAF